MGLGGRAWRWVREGGRWDGWALGLSGAWLVGSLGGGWALGLATWAGVQAWWALTKARWSVKKQSERRVHSFMEGLKVGAHRGAADDWPENTLLAFSHAKDNGADFVELDLQFTRDGVPVVFHDDTLERVTEGCGSVDEADWPTLARLNSAAKFQRKDSAGHTPSAMVASQSMDTSSRIEVMLPGTAKDRDSSIGEDDSVSAGEPEWKPGQENEMGKAVGKEADKEAGKAAAKEPSPGKRRGAELEIPTLDEAVGAVLDMGLSVIIDVKKPHPLVTQTLVGLWKRHPRLYCKGLVASFHPVEIWRVRLWERRILCAHTWCWDLHREWAGTGRECSCGRRHSALSGRLWDWATVALVHSGLLTRLTGVSVLLPPEGAVSEDYVAFWALRGVALVPWTVNDLHQRLFFLHHLRLPFMTDRLSDLAPKLKLLRGQSPKRRVDSCSLCDDESPDDE